jgi:hypothetical protein
MRRATSCLATALLFIVASADAQTAASHDDASELAKKTQDPTADLISVPIQFNYFADVGPFGRGQTVVNIQPVYPVNVNDQWKLITRYILPVVDAPIGENDNKFGLADLNVTAWLSPKKSAFIWGAGLSGSVPSATSDALGSKKWTVGPSFVFVVMKGPWVMGGLVSDVFSIAGDSARPDVNTMTIQPFFNYNLSKGSALSYGPIITYDWKADGGNRLTFPLGLGYSKTTRIGKRPMKFAGAGFFNVVRPDNAPKWQLQGTVTLIFPK